MKIIFVFYTEIVLFLHFEPGLSERSYFWVKRTQILQKLQRLSSDFAALMPKWRFSGWAFAGKQAIEEQWVLCRRCRSWLQVSHQRQTITVIHPQSSQVNYYREIHCYEFIKKLNLTSLTPFSTITNNIKYYNSLAHHYLFERYKRNETLTIFSIAAHFMRVEKPFSYYPFPFYIILH